MASPKNNPRQLSPGELCKLLNSTPIGEVIDTRKLYNHRNAAGLRIGDGKTVDLIRYVGWLVKRRADKAAEDPYELIKERSRLRSRAINQAGRNIGELPEVKEPERKAKAKGDFRFFCEQYFPVSFGLSWSDDHLKVISKIEDAVLKGGLFAMAMPRGSGKTTLCECACIWALLYGHHAFVCLIGADEQAACDMLDSVKTELENNDHLYDDFPSVCFPIRALDGIAHRANGQLYLGKRTQIGWSAKEVILPTMPDSVASGAVIRVAGITGRVRGMKFKTADGRATRPSLVIIDDPQTDESAKSLSQSANREGILAGAVLGLAGPGKKISGIMPCTVIKPGDMADNILDRNKHPEWNGERTRMVYDFPTDEKLWQKYAEIRADGLRNGDDGEAATEFYRSHREDMDAGAVIAWPERFNHDELSAIQHAMNLKLRDEEAFFAEYQNDPCALLNDIDALPTTEELMGRLSYVPRGEVPIGAHKLTAFIDVQKAMFFYVVMAWKDDFTGWVIDYGTWPDQRSKFFALRDARYTLQRAFPGSGLEGQLFSGLEALGKDVLSRTWRQSDGTEVMLERVGIDANWNQSTATVRQFCRESAWKRLLLPCHGQGDARARKIGETTGKAKKPSSQNRTGDHWRTSLIGQQAHIVYDTNYWKSFAFNRLQTSPGDRGAVVLHGNDERVHRMFCDQLTAEYKVRVSVNGGAESDQWKLYPGRENHWLDCFVGAHVMASERYCQLASAAVPSLRPKKKRKRQRVHHQGG